MQQRLSSTETFTPLVSVLKLEWKVEGGIACFLQGRKRFLGFHGALSAELHLIVTDTHLGRMNIAY